MSTGIGFNGADFLAQAALLTTVSYLQAVGSWGQKTLGKSHGAKAAPGTGFPYNSNTDGKSCGESPHHDKDRTNGPGITIYQEESCSEQSHHDEKNGPFEPSFFKNREHFLVQTHFTQESLMKGAHRADPAAIITAAEESHNKHDGHEDDGDITKRGPDGATDNY
jgi:hypothetical protein